MGPVLSFFVQILVTQILPFKKVYKFHCYSSYVSLFKIQALHIHDTLVQSLACNSRKASELLTNNERNAMIKSGPVRKDLTLQWAGGEALEERDIILLLKTVSVSPPPPPPDSQLPFSLIFIHLEEGFAFPIPTSIPRGRCNPFSQSRR